MRSTWLALSRHQLKQVYRLQAVVFQWLSISNGEGKDDKDETEGKKTWPISSLQALLYFEAVLTSTAQA